MGGEGQHGELAARSPALSSLRAAVGPLSFRLRRQMLSEAHPHEASTGVDLVQVFARQVAPRGV